MIKSIYPCLWFNENAKQAADFYCAHFPTSKILQESPIVISFEINGTKFMGLNGGPKYSINSSISNYVYCGNEEQINKLYHALKENGSVLMPLDKYEWSPKYAWITDKFGVNWQLDVDDINSTQKIAPSLLFANSKMTMVKNALSHYHSIFPHAKIILEAPYPPGTPIEAGTLLFAQIKLNGFIINTMSSTLKHDFDFSPAYSLVIECDTQEQIDDYWDKLGQDGRYDMCGWLTDKFGVSWQIVPTILGKLMSDPEKAPRVMQAFLQMKKFDIAKLLKA